MTNDGTHAKGSKGHTEENIWDGYLEGSIWDGYPEGSMSRQGNRTET